MTRLQKIQASIGELPLEDFVRLRQWVLEKDWERWDAEIERDSKSGKLDFLIQEAMAAKADGRLEDL